MAKSVPITYFAEPALPLFAVRIRASSGPITYFTERALLLLADTVMCEVGAGNNFHGASVTVVDWHGYVRGCGT